MQRLKESPTWQKFSESKAGAVLLALLALLLAPFLWLANRIRNRGRGGGESEAESTTGNDHGQGQGPQDDQKKTEQAAAGAGAPPPEAGGVEPPEPGSGPAPDGPPTPDDQPEDTKTDNTETETETGSGANRPGPASTNGVPMSVNPLLTASTELQSSVVRHVPENMWAVHVELGQLPQVMENVALAFRTYVQRLNDEYPIDSTVTDQMFTLFDQVGKAATSAQEIGKVFEQVHAEDIKRKTAPRRNEQAWNV